jgi:hypothetical protein
VAEPIPVGRVDQARRGRGNQYRDPSALPEWWQDDETDERCSPQPPALRWERRLPLLAVFAAPRCILMPVVPGVSRLFLLLRSWGPGPRPWNAIASLPVRSRVTFWGALAMIVMTATRSIHAEVYSPESNGTGAPESVPLSARASSRPAPPRATSQLDAEPSPCEVDSATLIGKQLACFPSPFYAVGGIVRPH